MSSNTKTDANFSTHALEEILPKLDNLNLSDLHKLRDLVVTKSKEVEARDRANALEQIKTIAAGVGMSIPDIMNFRPDTTVKPVYRNPQNHNETWTGRGRQPKWVSDWVNGGNHIDSLRM